MANLQETLTVSDFLCVFMAIFLQDARLTVVPFHRQHPKRLQGLPTQKNTTPIHA